MSGERSQKAREVAFRRRRGASEAHAAKVKQSVLGAEDLHTTCQRCGETVSGTIDQIKAHVESCDGH